jgi:Zn-dependent peptidase ImmA (M78 family)
VAFALSDWVGERFSLPEPDLLDLSLEGTPESAARSLRQYWGLGEAPVSNMIKLLESKGVRVFSLSENTNTVDAFSCWRNETPYVFLNTFKTAERSRFDAAHELGHLVLHQHGGPQQAREAEAEANQFAVAFLMPSADVVACVPVVASVDRLLIAKKRWRVSAMALAYRLHKLAIVSDWQYRSLCIELGRRGYRSGEPDGIERETSIVWQKVFSQLWTERITREDIARDLCIPASEIESVVFGLVGRRSKTPPAPSRKVKPMLRLVE